MNLLYRGLVALHPRAFRQQFGAEMELIFDDAGRRARLLADGFVSLGRQWFLRTKLWIFALAFLGGLIPFALGFGIVSFAGGSLGVGPVPHRHIRALAVQRISPPVDVPFVIMTAMIALLFILGTMLFAITWFRFSQHKPQRKRA